MLQPRPSEQKITHYIKLESKELSCYVTAKCMMKSFVEQFPLAERKKEAQTIRKKYPDRLPIIVERDKHSRSLPDIDKHKYLVPKDMSVGQFLYVIRRRIQLKPDKALYLFFNNTLPPTAMLMSELYAQHKDESGFLVGTYYEESTFGGM